MTRSGISERNRWLLERLHAAIPGPFTAAEAAALLEVPVASSRALLAYLASRGWLARVRRGLYTTVPLGATAPSEWREDPWVVAAKILAPCYIGGWSACEHWELTEQLFREIVVVTTVPVRRSATTIQGTAYRLKSVGEKKLFGTLVVWRGQNKVNVSDPSRTVVDILDDPTFGGGIRHVAHVLFNYFSGGSRDDVHLLDYAKRVENRAVFKRLGYLLEILEIPALELIEHCRRAQSSGLTALDPSVKKPGRILKRWNLRVNAAVDRPEVSP